MKYIFCLILFSILFGCNFSNKEPVTIFCNYPYPDIKIEKISLKEKDRIKELDGKFIQIEGTMSNNFEDVAIYPFKNHESKNALWLGYMIADSISEKKAYSLDAKKVMMIGKVNLSSKGHLGAYLGTLDSIVCVKAL